MIGFIVLMLIVVLSVSVILEVFMAYTKHRMHRRSRYLESIGVKLSDAEKRHGMELSNDGRGVVSTQKPSPAWYRRLIK